MKRITSIFMRRGVIVSFFLFSIQPALFAGDVTLTKKIALEKTEEKTSQEKVPVSKQVEKTSPTKKQKTIQESIPVSEQVKKVSPTNKQEASQKSVPVPEQVIKASPIKKLEKTKCKPLSFRMPINLPDGKVNFLYRNEIKIAGGAKPFTFKTTSHPLLPGLHVNDKGILFGKLTKPGSYQIKLNVSDSCVPSQKIEKIFKLIVRSDAVNKIPNETKMNSMSESKRSSLRQFKTRATIEAMVKKEVALSYGLQRVTVEPGVVFPPEGSGLDTVIFKRIGDDKAISKSLDFLVAISGTATALDGRPYSWLPHDYDFQCGVWSGYDPVKEANIWTVWFEPGKKIVTCGLELVEDSEPEEAETIIISVVQKPGTNDIYTVSEGNARTYNILRSDVPRMVEFAQRDCADFQIVAGTGVEADKTISLVSHKLYDPDPAPTIEINIKGERYSAGGSINLDYFTTKVTFVPTQTKGSFFPPYIPVHDWGGYMKFIIEPGYGYTIGPDGTCTIRVVGAP